MELSSLAAALHAADPSAVLAPSWLVRQVIIHDRDVGHIRWVPHAQVYVIARQRLLDIVERENLPFTPERPLAETVILLPEPESDWLGTQAPADVLRGYWRMLFHGRVDAALGARLDGDLAGAALQQRIERLGRRLYGEARFILHKERFLAPSAGDRDAYIELAAVYLELHYFAPERLPHFFPAVEDPQRMLDALAHDLDAARLLSECRLAGADDPLPAPASQSRLEACTTMARAQDERPAPVADDTGTPPARAARKSLLRRAQRAEATGNVVWAATLRMRACRSADARGLAIADEALQNLHTLVDRLRAVLGFDEAAVAEWRTALAPLLGTAARGWWYPEKRLLYDLQKACIDHEREIYSVDVVKWALALGRKPLRRPLPGQREVLICKHLRSAGRRLVLARLSDSQRARLEALLKAAVHQAEEQLRQYLRPLVCDALRQSSLHPGNVVEEVARDKLVEELLDHVVHRGFLAMGDVRDAISRNQLKLPDLTADQFLGRDPLLEIDHHLADDLDGIYRRGEIYLRFFQRVIAVLFATPAGRLLTRFVLGPIGGAYLILHGLDHTVGWVIGKLTGFHLVTAHNSSLVVVALFLMGVVNWPAFRRAAAGFAAALFHALSWALIDLPAWLATRQLVQAVAGSRAVRLALRYGVKPAIFILVPWFLVPHKAPLGLRVGIYAAVFAAANLLLNSRPGRIIEQAIRHSLGGLWNRFTAEILAGLFRLVMQTFERLLDGLDRLIYEVDEWLRFRTGQSRAALVAKAVLGIFWFLTTYLVRFALNLIIEPQINPIKHFPVVTVAHKINLTMVPHYMFVLEGVGFGHAKAGMITAVMTVSIPGIFGFLAWELRENWRLYRANRSRVLGKVQVGSHGESMARFLRPGIHSGTVPKIFARLRRAQRRPATHRSLAAVRKQLQLLAHVRESVGDFIQRDFLALLNQRPAFRAAPVTLGGVRLAATSIRIELLCPALSATPAIVCFEQRWGWVLAGIDAAGWIEQLVESQAHLLSIALAGLYKMSGVDIVREQIESLFAPRPIRFDIEKTRLLIWPDDDFSTRIAYDLSAERLEPEISPPGAAVEAPAIEHADVLLRQTNIDWNAWVAVWNAPDAAPATPLPMPNVETLPLATASRAFVGSAGRAPAGPISQ